LIRLSVPFICYSLLALVGTACGGSFIETPQTSTQSNPTHFPSIGSTRTGLPTLPQLTSVWTLEPAASLTPEPATVSPTLPSTPTLSDSVSNPTQFPNPDTYEWQLILSGLARPIGLTNAGDGSGRLFVIEQSGVIRVIRDNDLLPEPFLDISGQVSCCGERGLLGLAFHPEYNHNGYFFVNYTDINNDTVIARFQVSDEVDQANLSSEVKLLIAEQPFNNHNGGSLAFGPDGYLYVGLGDGGSGGDPLGNAQNTDVLLGKLLRLDVDRGDLYAIPPDNPFANGGGAPEVWVSGLRNPWRFSFDRLTGDLYIGDVGQGSWEEIDFLPAGNSGRVNFGWNYMEGAHPYSTSLPPGDTTFTDPVAEYGRDQGISVIGGLVYRGDQLPDWQGIYLYGDYGSGFIWGLLRDVDGSWQNALLFQTDTRITSYGEDEDGEVYYVSYEGGLYRFAIR
jgi:glucose/arabinose dehydrogenase